MACIRVLAAGQIRLWYEVQGCCTDWIDIRGQIVARYASCNHRSAELVIRCPRGNCTATGIAARQCLLPGGALNRPCERGIGKDASALIGGHNLQNAGAGTRHLAGLLYIRKEEKFVLQDWTTNNASELVPLQCSLSGIEVAGRIQTLVAIKLKQISMEAVGS